MLVCHMLVEPEENRDDPWPSYISAAIAHDGFWPRRGVKKLVP